MSEKPALFVNKLSTSDSGLNSDTILKYGGMVEYALNHFTKEHLMISRLPCQVEQLLKESFLIDFQMACEDTVGAFLRVLAASKRDGNFLEIGTGTGVGTAWILDGMDASSHLTSIDINPIVQAVANKILGDDPRLTLIQIDGAEYLRSLAENYLDLIFVDFRPGKFFDRDLAFRALKQGGFYFVDDLLPQSTWPVDHQSRVDSFFLEVQADERIVPLYLNTSSGIFVAVKR